MSCILLLCANMGCVRPRDGLQSLGSLFSAPFEFRIAGARSAKHTFTPEVFAADYDRWWLLPVQKYTLYAAS